MNRRTFLHQGSAALAFAAAATYVPTTFAAEPKPKRVGLIGTGWYGKSDIYRLMQIAPVEIVSLCDVDQRLLNDCADTAQKKNKSGKRPRIYTDYTKMLAEKDLEIVEIATPDHWHALPMIAACQAGADIYCQKPIGVDVVEGQAMVAAARKYGRVVQIGTQRRSTPHLIAAKERFIESGALGKIISVDVSCYWHMRSTDTLATAPDTAPPDYLDYERWVGPAPFMPYNKIVHPRGWRAYMEYGNGIVGDMCVHMFDMTRWLLNLGWPTSITSWGGILHDQSARANITDTQTATFDFNGFQVTWNHRTWGDMPDPDYPWATVIHGEKGTLKLSVFRYDFVPRNGGPVIHKDQVMELDKYPEDNVEKDLEKHVAPAIRGHMKNLLDCIETRAKPVADVEQGHISSASCILANMSLKLGRTLKWDAAKQEVIGDPEANALLKRPYRAPYTHPTPESV